MNDTDKTPSEQPDTGKSDESGQTVNNVLGNGDASVDDVPRSGPDRAPPEPAVGESTRSSG